MISLVFVDWFWTWSAIVHGKLNERISSKILSIAWYWRVLLMWVCIRLILYMRRSSEVVTRQTCHCVAVIWAGKPNRRPKISLSWWWGQGYLAGNIRLRIMLYVERWFKFLEIEGSILARMRVMQGLWSLHPEELSEILLMSNPSMWGWCAREISRHWK